MDPPHRPVTLAHRLHFAIFRGISKGLALLPAGGALAVAGGLGWFAGAVLRIRRKVVDENLARAFPGESAAWRARLARRSYVHLAQESALLLRGGEGAQSVEFQGREILEAALARGKGVLIVSGHFGNWELAGSAVAGAGVPLDVVAAPQRNPLFHAEMERSRAALGMQVFMKADATRPILRSLAKGRAVALVADQNVWTGELWIPFFGVDAATTRGPALLALRTGAPLIFIVGYREPGRPLRYTVSMEEVEVDPTGDLEADLHRVTRRYVAILERWIRAHPEKYFWHHRRWKRSPPTPSVGGGPPGTVLPTHGTTSP